MEKLWKREYNTSLPPDSDIFDTNIGFDKGGITSSTQIAGSSIFDDIQQLQEEIKELRKENKILAQYIFDDIKLNK